MNKTGEFLEQCLEDDVNAGRIVSRVSMLVEELKEAHTKGDRERVEVLKQDLVQALSADPGPTYSRNYWAQAIRTRDI